MYYTRVSPLRKRTDGHPTLGADLGSSLPIEYCSTSLMKLPELHMVVVQASTRSLYEKAIPVHMGLDSKSRSRSIPRSNR